MQNPLDLFAERLRAARARRNITQRQLADKLNMSVRTIIELEKCNSSPRFETVAALAQEMNISLDAVVFQDMQSDTISKNVIDFFSGKSEKDVEKYLELCRHAEALTKAYRDTKGD